MGGIPLELDILFLAELYMDFSFGFKSSSGHVHYKINLATVGSLGHQYIKWAT